MLARRDRIVAALSAIVPGEGVIASERAMRPYESDGLTATVLVGELGTKLETMSDKQWLSSLVQYMKGKGMSFTYWSLNPNSTDTGGILNADWQTLNQEKLMYLTSALAPLIPVQ